jgi:hypothetical protein
MGPGFAQHRQKTQAPNRHCAEICSFDRKQKARLSGPFEVGGTCQCANQLLLAAAALDVR